MAQDPRFKSHMANFSWTTLQLSMLQIWLLYCNTPYAANNATLKPKSCTVYQPPAPPPLYVLHPSVILDPQPPPPTHNRARLSNLLLLLCSITALPNSLASSPLNVPGATVPFPLSSPPAIASPNNFPPNSSASPTTRVLTVAPSRLFLPSRRLDAIFSVNFHSLPSAGASRPVAASRAGRQSGARRRRGGTRGSRDRTTWMMPSSSKRWYEFLRVSLLTASK